MRTSKVSKYMIMLMSLILFTSLCVENMVRAAASFERNKDDSEDKVVYLTFDDGPIPGVTEKLLDVLKEYNVKSTFFVVGKEIKEREAILKRIHEEGHSIGIHTFSHNFKTIYKSDEAFLSEVDETAKLIETVIGCKASAVRFPGGSDKMLTPELLDKLHDKGYMIYDWNVSLEDGFSSNLSVGTLIKNAKKARGDKNRRFILAHCNSNNKTTYLALPTIIDYYRDEGFTFKAIDKNTEEYYYKFRKR